ncbi:hypothetical protein CRYUN_Cryun02cG0213000 [Craigia yunnanensis]
MDDDNSNTFRRMSSRTRKVAPKMAAALGSSDNRTQRMVLSRALWISMVVVAHTHSHHRYNSFSQGGVSLLEVIA